MKLPEIKEELKKRGIEFKQNDKKTNLLERLEVFLLNPDRVKEYQPEAEKREIETQTEQPHPHRLAMFFKENIMKIELKTKKKNIID